MKLVAFDIETSSRNKYTCDMRLVCVNTWERTQGGIYTSPTAYTVHPLENVYNKQLQKDLDEADGYIAHNAGFDISVLIRSGYKFNPNTPIHDTMLMAKHWRNDLPSYSLKNLSWYLFGDTHQPLLELRSWVFNNNVKEDEEDEFNMMTPPFNLVQAYCDHDTHMTMRLFIFLYPFVKDNYAYKIDSDCIRSTMKTEANGITIDVPFLMKFKQLGKRRIGRNTKTASEELKTDEGKSPTGDALRKRLKELGETERTASDKVKADSTVLRKWKKDKGVRAVERIRTDQKLVNTYADNILSVVVDDRFHPNLFQSTTITRRFTSRSMYGDNGIISKGQVQNIPRGDGIRTAIIAPKGFGVVKLDLASIEARIGANAMSVFLDEDWFSEQYRNDDKFNIYLHVVRECTGHENVTKKDLLYTAYKHGCLGIQYGVGLKTFYMTLHDKFGLPYSVSECSAIYNDIRKKFPVFSALQRCVSQIIEKQGYIMDDFGATYYVPSDERYKGVNYYCQGCAGNIFKWWVVELDKILIWPDYMFNFVHDEIDLCMKRNRSVKGRIKDYCDVLKGLDIFSTPIIAESSGVCDNWGECG